MMAKNISLVKKINRKVVLPVRHALDQGVRLPYYFLRTRSVTNRILDYRSDALRKEHTGTPSPLQARIMSTLEEHGIAWTHLDELFPDRSMLPGLERYTEALLARAREGRKKKFLEYGWADKQPVEFDNPLLSLSLEPSVLTIAAHYLGTAAKLKFFSCNKTIPMAAGAEAQGSQRWHRDPGVGRIFKLFLYLSDVDESAGPFMYVAGSHRGGRFAPLWKSKSFGRYGIYPPEGAVENTVPKEAIKVGTGRAGTMIFCDTLGLHRGGYSTARERVMYTALYEPPSAFGRSTLILPEARLVEKQFTDPLARFALTR